MPTWRSPPSWSHNLLTHGQVTGWDPGWYDGFPLYTFYFPLPGLLTVALNAVVPYDVAFKLVTVLGSLLLPLCAWAFGRLARMRDPIPACLAAATLPFLFEPSFSIYGGNLLSTLAGEFSFSLSLSLALLFLGVVASGLRTGRHRALAAVLLAATLLCHLIPALFAVAGAGLLLLLDADLPRAIGRSRRAVAAGHRWGGRVLWSVAAGLVGLGLCAWWLVPFLVEQPYTTDMGYTKVFGYPHLLFPGSFRWVLALDAVAVVAMVARRSRMALFLLLMGGLSAAAVILDPASKLYNVRFLPLWFLCLYLLAGYAVAEVVSAVARLARRRRLNLWVGDLRRRLASTDGSGWSPGRRVTPYRRPVPAAAAAGAVVGPLVALLGACHRRGAPAGRARHRPREDRRARRAGPAERVGGVELQRLRAQAGLPGVRGRPPDDAPGRGGAGVRARHVGVRPVVEPVRDHRVADAAALLHGRVHRQPGGSPVRVVVDHPVPLHHPGRGVPQPVHGGRRRPPWRLRRARRSPRDPASPGHGCAVPPDLVDHGPGRRGSLDPAATLIGSTGPWATTYNGESLDTTWKVYRIADSQLVVPLTDRPVVWSDVEPNQSCWLPPAVAWFNTPSRWNVVPAADGPADWTRVTAADGHPAAVPEPKTTVSDVRQTDSSISFHVDRVGVPVEVRASYFPNWHATGAEGPYRAAPNLMVVVPTSNEVTLTYGRSSADDLGQLLTALAVAAAVLLAAVDRRAAAGTSRRPGRTPWRGGGAGGDRSVTYRARDVPAVHRALPGGRPAPPRVRGAVPDPDGRCLAADGEFGVVLIARGSEVGGGDQRTDVGTVARIANVAELDDGRLLVVATGVRRVRVEEWLPDDPYPCAVVADLPGLRRRRARSRCWRRPRDRCVGSAPCCPSSGTFPRCPTACASPATPTEVGWQLCDMAPLVSLDLQRLLAADGLESRMRLLVGAVRRHERRRRRPAARRRGRGARRPVLTRPDPRRPGSRVRAPRAGPGTR